MQQTPKPLAQLPAMTPPNRNRLMGIKKVFIERNWVKIHKSS